MTARQQLESVLLKISEEGSAPVEAWPEGAVTSSDLGLVESEGSLRWPGPLDLLDRSVLAERLDGWDIRVFQLIDSTNSELLRDGESATVDHRLYLAEFQHGGRGRRGRTWLSPYARNLAMSLGMATARGMPALGVLSSVVGLALCAALEQLGVAGIALKWPNDVLVDDKKISGILVELIQRGPTVEYVVGIGVNVALSEAEIDQIDQPVTDLRRAGVAMSRSHLAALIIERVVEHLNRFEEEGFGPFIEAFNAAHKFHNMPCRLVQGSEEVTGTAIGVGESGELIVETSRGRQSFHGGEVSLRDDRV